LYKSEINNKENSRQLCTKWKSLSENMFLVSVKLRLLTLDPIKFRVNQVFNPYKYS